MRDYSTKHNRQSPLLGLPAEIRNEIWKLVLGGKEYRATSITGGTYKLSSSPLEPTHAMALLRTCRQIYAEAALMPLAHNTMSFEYLSVIKVAINKLKPHQRKNITCIKINLLSPNCVHQLGPSYIMNKRVSLPRILPGLKEIHVRIFKSTAENAPPYNVEEKLHQYLAPSVIGMPVDLKIERMELTYNEYDESYV